MKNIIFLLLISQMILVYRPEGIICQFCENVQKSVFSFYRVHKEKIFDFFDGLCKLKGTIPLCDYFVYKDGYFLIDNEVNFYERTNYLCSHIFDYCDKTFEKYDYEEFRENLYKKYPYKREEKNKSFKKEFTSLVLTDVHLQRDYLYKSKVNCSDPAGCCFEPAEESDPKKAGYWGSPRSRCDTPKHFWENTLENLKKEEYQTDFIFLLGDNYGHAYFRDDSTDYLVEWNKYFYESIKQNFPNSKIIPVLGNHEADPVDYFNFEDAKNFVIENIFPNFNLFIDEKKTQDYAENGFYDLEFDEFNVKFIALNSQLGDVENFSLIDPTNDPLNFFEKLTESIYESEKKDQKVIFLNHINLGNDGNYDGYEKNMYAIIERFNQTITTTLSGHTHTDEFRFIKNQQEEIIHMDFLNPSLTTFGNYHPSFRIYNFSNNKVENYIQYRFDIDYYNQKAEDQIFDFKFDFAYDFKKEYNIDSLESFSDYEKFKKALSNDDDKEFQKKYLKNKNTLYEADDNWEHQSFYIKCEILGLRLEQQKCIDAVNGGPSILDFLNPLYFFRYVFVRPWLVPIN